MTDRCRKLPLFGDVLGTPYSVLRPLAHRRRIAVSVLAVVPQPSDDQVRRQLDDVFSRPEFSPDHPDWIGRVLEWLAELFHQLGRFKEADPLLFWLFLAAAVELLIVLLGFIVWTLRPTWIPSGGRLRAQRPQEERARLSRTYRDEAQRRAAEGDFTEAIRCLFLSLVYRFDESGRVNWQQAYTNREYLALFGDRPTVHDPLRVFVDTLDDYWYAQRPTDARRYDQCLALYEGLMTA